MDPVIEPRLATVACRAGQVQSADLDQAIGGIA